MTAQRREDLIKEARIHYDWLRQNATLEEIEVTTSEIRRLWNIDATAETVTVLSEYNKPVKRYTRAGHLIEEPDAPGAFV